MANRIALVYDKFLVEGGGERIFKIMADTFPNAEIYALNAYPKKVWEARFGRKIITPPLGFLFRSRYVVIALYPIACLLMKLLKVNADKTLIYSSSCGKYIGLNSKIRVLYSNYPNRGVFETKAVIKNSFMRFIMAPFIGAFKFFEISQLSRFSMIYSISETSKFALEKYTGYSSNVLVCPYASDFLSSSYNQKINSRNREEPSFLIISRLETEKDIEYVIEAFKKFNFKLRVIGIGSQLSYLSKIASSNVKFLGFLSDAELVEEILNCTALIFPSDIEYSLVPLEANALGIPVVSYNSVSARELLIDINDNNELGTAVFYESHNSKDLEVSLQVAIKHDWDHEVIKMNVNRFDPEIFKNRLREIFQ